MKKFRILMLVLGLLIIIQIGAFGAGRLPALGWILDPFHGLWQNGEAEESGRSNKVNHPLLAPVYWDKEGVPHVFAKSLESLYFTQGFITAKQRLFQMELQSRLLSGELSEWVGEKANKIDQFYVSLGMRKTAEQNLKLMLKNPESKLALDAYAMGVNAYINQLDFKDFPPEYKVLNQAPRAWLPVHTNFVALLMTYRLGAGSEDLELTRLAKKIGIEKVNDLFPDHPFNEVPIINKQWAAPSKEKKLKWNEGFLSDFDYWDIHDRPDPSNGSNSWAIGSKKSKTGNPILLNDTHLSYSAPGVWYELQLNGPDHNVYGVSIPGIPGILIGFNESIGWASTNAPIDVLDWFDVPIKFENQQMYYRSADLWLPAEARDEILFLEGKTTKITQWWTEFGVVVKIKKDRALILNWLAHRPSDPLTPFLSFNRAKSFSECLSASRMRSTPAQSIICSDKENIGVEVSGEHYLKPYYFGRYVLDGSLGRELIDLKMAGPLEKFSEINPKSGFVFSANQTPAGSSYPYYLGWRFRDSYRGGRIHNLLSSDRKFSLEDLFQMQNDVFNGLAEEVLPSMLSQLDLPKFSQSDSEALKILKDWDLNDSKDSIGATLFWSWWKGIGDKVWEPIWSEDKGMKLRPHDSRLSFEILKASQGEETQLIKKDDVKKLLVDAFKKSLVSLEKEFGPDMSKWGWKKYQKTEIPHISKIPGWGQRGIEMGGSIVTINSNKGWHGPVWKMAVEFKPDGPEAYVNLPGGNSGNPLDKDFSKYLESWRDGKMRKALFFREIKEVPLNEGYWTYADLEKGSANQ